MQDKPAAAIEQLGECALLVRLGQAISEAANDRVHALAHALRSREIRGLGEIVPAYVSLLVTFDPEVLPEPVLHEYIAEAIDNPAKTPPAAKRNHSIPVLYGGDDGPDLREVAELHDLTTSQVIALHSGREYRVYFLGFMPGFGYMGRLSSKIASSRLPTPRVRVPEGSVGLAGTQTGVYPFASPGGWRIIGRTPVSLWDSSSSEPSLFSPGDSVRFVQSAERPTQGPRAGSARPIAQRPLFQVEGPGVLTTVQDLGRPGYAHSGLCESGAYDKDAVVRANSLLGNDPGAAVLEMTWTGPTLRALYSTTIALEGADLGCRVDGVPAPPGMSWFVRSGTTISFSRSAPAQSGARGYLAVAGGIEVPAVLGSRSTYLPAGIGGYLGRALWAGDQLEAGTHSYSQSQVAGRIWLGRSEVSFGSAVNLRFVRYRGTSGVPNRALDSLAAKQWQVSGHSDRMGTRLTGEDGQGISFSTKEMISFGVVRGSIQLPPDGNPVILGVDHQTTGGYPLLGVVCRADFALVGQLRPGDWVRFTELGVDEASAALREARRELERGIGVIKGMT